MLSAGTARFPGVIKNSEIQDKILLYCSKTKLVSPTLNNANMAEDILTNLSTQLGVLNAQTNQVNRVSIKLPEFWTKSQEVWFARVEAQFGTKGITQHHTKYDYIVSALDINTTEEVQSVLINPPAENKYNTLKEALIKTFGKLAWWLRHPPRQQQTWVPVPPSPWIKSCQSPWFRCDTCQGNQRYPLVTASLAWWLGHSP